jgi:hypothetical protein
MIESHSLPYEMAASQVRFVSSGKPQRHLASKNNKVRAGHIQERAYGNIQERITGRAGRAGNVRSGKAEGVMMNEMRASTEYGGKAYKEVEDTSNLDAAYDDYTYTDDASMEDVFFAYELLTTVPTLAPTVSETLSVIDCKFDKQFIGLIPLSFFRVQATCP